MVDLLGVALPDLDRCALDRVSLAVENPTGDVGDLADGGRDAVADDDEVVIPVERELTWIKRALGALGGRGEVGGEKSSRGVEGRACRAGAHENPSARSLAALAQHGFSPRLTKKSQTQPGENVRRKVFGPIAPD